MKKTNAQYITYGAAIAALYVVLTVFIDAFSLASGAIQFRISEALCIMPLFTPAAIPGLFVGCFLANLITGAAIWDVIFGSVATLIGAVGTYLLKKHPLVSPVAPVLSNTLIIPWILKFAYGAPDAIPFLMLTVCAGEMIACFGLGLVLYGALKNHKAVFSTGEAAKEKNA